MIDSHALDVLFRTARTQNGWLPTPVTDDELRRVFDLMRMAPTSANTQPARFVFLRTPAAKERLRPMLSPGKSHPDVAAVEKLFFDNNARTAMKVGEARGVLLLTLAQAAPRLAGAPPRGRLSSSSSFSRRPRPATR